MQHLEPSRSFRRAQVVCTLMEYAHVVLAGTGGEVDLGRLAAGERCALGFIDDLLQLHLAARRFGLSVVLVDIPEELEELVDLLGLDRRLSLSDQPGGPEGLRAD